MFKKLRNKFLILNMSITSAVMLVAFAIIYFITYSNIHADINNKLSSGAEIQVSQEEPDAPNGPEKGESVSQHVSMDGPLSFWIEVDKNGKILNVDSFVDLPEEAFQKAAKIAWSKQKSATVTLEGKQWQYAISQMKKHVIQGEGQEYTVEEDKYQILFLDVTESKKTLFDLLLTLLFVGIIMLIAIFFISLYFANRAIQPIAAAWEKQKQFVADASHELKTPLSIINANYDVLLANKEETIKSQLKWFGYMRIGTDRMAKLISDLLSLAKIENAAGETVKMTFNLSEAVHEIISSMEAVVMEKGIHLCDTIEPDIMAKGEAEKVKQVIMILFDNAVKYVEENGRIEITLTKVKRKVIFSIKNSGKGIANQDLPKVFDRFYRADPSRTHESGGYGLGLSIAKAIIDQMGGEIYVTSVENEWTAFTFVLGYEK